jgi:hypothetical protein
MAAQRSRQEIRASIEANRIELERSLGKLRGEVTAAADWRAHIAHHRREVMIGAGVAGFLLGGGLAAIGGLFRRG